ncbi:MAG TPA: CBS domain-containing protein, partial [Polyangia bacterium]
MRVAELILAKPHYVVTGQTVVHAAKRMMTFGLNLLPVCRSEGTVIGVVTAWHIVKAVAQGRAAELCAIDDVMS